MSKHNWKAALRAKPIITGYVNWMLSVGRIRTRQDADDIVTNTVILVAQEFESKFRPVEDAVHDANRFRRWVKLTTLREQRRTVRSVRRLTHSEDLTIPNSTMRFEAQIEAPSGSKGSRAAMEASVLAREILEATGDPRSRVVAVGIMTGMSLTEIGTYIGYSKSTGGNMLAVLRGQAKGLVAEPSWDTLPSLPTSVGITFVERAQDAGKLRGALAYPLPAPVIRRINKRISELSAGTDAPACVPA